MSPAPARPPAVDRERPALFLRDGLPWDLAARKQAARRAVESVRRPQPRGIARPPGPSSLRVARSILRREPGTDLFGGIAERFPGIAHVRVGRDHLYVLSDPDLVVQVLLTEARQTAKGRALLHATALLGEGLLTSHGELHARQRALVMPAFHRARINGYAAEMVDAAIQRGDMWDERTTAGPDLVDMASEMSTLTLQIVGRTLFGTDVAGEAANFSRAVTEVLEGFDRVLVPGSRLADRLRLAWVRRMDRASEELDVLVARVILERRERGDREDLLSMLLSAADAEGGMSDAQLRDEVMTLVLAGHETTAMALSWAWHLLDRNPIEAGALHEELDRVLVDAQGAWRPPEPEDLARLPRTRAVVAETLRLRPPAWILGRTLLADLRVAGWTLPAGSIVLALPWTLHRDPRFWDEALAFRPGRWIDEQGRFAETNPGQPRGAWFPFGFGNRRCIGDQFAWTEAALVLATLASRFAPKAAQGHEEVGVRPAVTLRPAGGMPMLLAARQRPGRDLS